jgi:EmrB/QacA subfamily drug resistance transporter
LKKVKYTSSEKWTLFATIMASSLVFIDGTALNIAMPALQHDMGLSGPQLLWVVNAYSLFLSALLLFGGAMGDQYGRNRIFGIGLFLFMLASFFCGISTNSNQLIAARVFQGVGGALLIPGSLSILTARFPPAKTGGAIGLWSTFSALTAVIGPLLGGWLAGIGLWRVIFFINIPFSLVALWAIFYRVAESKNSEVVKLDYVGAFLATLGLAGITYGFIESANKGFGDTVIVISLVTGGLSSIGFILSQHFGKHPMMPLKLFAKTDFSITNIATLFIYGALGATLFFLPLNLVQVQGYSEVQTGLSMLPVIILITLLSAVSGRMSDRVGTKLFLSFGPLITGFGFFLFGFQGVSEGPSEFFGTFFIPLVLLGLGMGLTVAPLTTTVMLSVSKNNSGVASGVNNAVSRMSGVLSIALLGTMVLFYFKQHLLGQLYDLEMPVEFIETLNKEAVNLGSTLPPANTPPEMIEKVEMIIKTSFVKSFNRVTLISAVAAWTSAVLCFVFLKSRKK